MARINQLVSRKPNSYMKNVAKSMGYIVQDFVSEYNPTIKDLFSNTKSASENLYQTIRDFKDDNKSDKTLGQAFNETTKAIFDNFKDDLKTGNWYNKARQEKVFDAAKMMGMDFDLDLDFGSDEDWGDFDLDSDDTSSFDDGDKAILSEQKQSTAQIINSMDRTGYAVASAVNEGQIESAKYIAESNQAGNRALYSLNQKGFASVTEALLAVNQSITTLGQLGQPLTAHMQNAGVFYTKTTEQLNSINEKLDQLVKNTTTSTDGGRSNKSGTTFSDILGMGDMLDMSGYLDMVKQNFANDKDLFDMAKNALKGIDLKNVSPGVLIGKMVTGAIIPKMMKDSMKEFNETLKYFINDTFIKGMHKLNSGTSIIGSLLADYFLPKNMGRLNLDKISGSNYERGPIQWDGEAKQALTRVIPKYLSEILSAISGTPGTTYDYKSGKFISDKSISKKLRGEKVRLAKNAGGDIYEAISSDISGDNTIGKAEKEKLNKEIEDLFISQLEKGDPFFLAKLMGPRGNSLNISRETLQRIRKVLEKTSKLDQIKYTTQMQRGRDEAFSWKRSEEENGNSLYTDDGFKDIRGKSTPGSALIDKYGNSMFDYMMALHQDVRYIAENIGGGKRKKVSGGIKIHGYKELSTTLVSTGEKTTAEIDKDNDKEKNIAYDKLESAYAKTLKYDEDGKLDKKGTLEGIKEKISDHFKEKGIFKGITGLPFLAASNLLNKLSSAMQSVIIGDPDNPETGLFGIIATKSKELFENLQDRFGGFFDKIKEKLFGKEGEDGKLSGGLFSDFFNESKESLKNSGSFIKDQIYSIAFGNHGEKLTNNQKNYKKTKENYRKAFDNYQRLFGENAATVEQAYSGRRYIKKSGLAVVSEGEMIIPSELNPYYSGYTDKYKQRSNENRILNRFFGKFADGEASIGGKGKPRINWRDRTVSFPDPDKPGATLDVSFENLTPQDIALLSSSQQKKLKKNLRRVAGKAAAAMQDAKNTRKNEFKEDAQNGDAGLVGDVYEGVSQGMNNIKRIFFGDKEPKQVNKATNNLLEEINKAKGGMGAGALIGLVGGSFAGMPLLGALAGSAIGFVQSSETAKNFLFGEIDENGERSGGVLGKEFAKFAKDNLPKTAAGAAIGGVGGLFLGSPVMGAVIGSTIGYVSSSEDAQKFLFGESSRDKNGKWINDGSGLIPREVIESLKNNKAKYAFAGTAAGLGGILGGPLGAAGGLVMASAINSFSASSKMTEFLFGKEGKDKKGVMHEFRNSLVDNTKELFHNTGNAITGWLKNTGRTIAKIISGSVKERTKKLKTNLVNLLSKSNFGKGIVDLAGRAREKLGGGVRNFMQNRADKRLRKNIQKGYMSYNAELGRNMTTAETLEMIKSGNVKGLDESSMDPQMLEMYKNLSGLKDESERSGARAALIEAKNNENLSMKQRLLAEKGIDLLDNDSKVAKAIDSSKSPELKEQEKTNEKIDTIIKLLVGGKPADEIKKKYTTQDVEDAIEEKKHREETGKKTIQTFFGAQQVTTNNEGEEVVDTTDKATVEAQKKSDKFFNSIEQIPVLGTAIGGISGLFGKMHDKLFGDGEDKEDKGLLGNLFSGLFGQEGIFATIKNFLAGTGTIGGFTLSSAITAFVAPALLVGGFSGAFDNFANKIIGGFKLFKGNDTKNAFGDESKDYVVDGKQVATDENGNPITNDKGQYQTVDGEWVSGNAQAVGSNNTLSMGLKKNLINGAIMGNGSVTTRVLGKAKNAIATAASKRAAKKATKKAAKAAAKGVANVADDVAAGALKGNISKGLQTVAGALKNIPGLKKIAGYVDDIITYLYVYIDDAIKAIAKKGGGALKKVTSGITKAMPLISVAYVVGKGINAWGNAESILGITKDATFGQKCMATIISCLNAAIPVIGDLIPDKTLVNIMIAIFKKIPGLKSLVEGLDQERQEAQEEVDAYNASHEGADLSIEEYNQMNGKAGIFTKMKLGVKSAITNVKEKGLKKSLADSKAGKAVKNAINSGKEMFGDVKTDVTNYMSACKALVALATKGDILSIWKYQYPETETQFNGMFKMVFYISRLQATMLGLVNKMISPLKTLWNKISGTVGKFVDDVKKDGLFTAVKNVVTKDKEDKKKKKSGSGSALYYSGGSTGHVYQFDDKYANQSMSGSTFGEKGCGPAVASMAANAFGKKLDVNNALSASKNYQNKNGVSMDYFPAVLGKQGIGTNTYTGKNAVVSSAKALSGGGKVILLGQDSNNTSKTNSPFGPNSHYVLATGIDKSGNIIVEDPESKSTTMYNANILKSVKAATVLGGNTSRGRSRALSGAGTEENAQQIYAYFTNNGYSPAAAAAIIGNLFQESGLQPDAIQGNGKGPAAGIAQWENYNTKEGRWLQLSQLASSRGKDWTDLDTQLEFINSEIGGLDAYFLGKGKAAKNLTKAGATPISVADWKQSTDVDMATRQFEAGFERAGKPAMENRIAKAAEYFNKFSGQTFNYTPSSGSTSSDGSTSTESTGFAGILSAIGSAFTNAFSKLLGGGDDTSTTTEDGSTSTGTTAVTGEGAQRLINVAANEIGYQEKASNSQLDDPHANVGEANYTKYGQFTGANGAPWCASFVSWAFNQAFGDKYKDIMGGTNASVSGLQSALSGRIDNTPQPGDIIIYKKGTSHTGIVESVDTANKTYTSIEGNTTGDSSSFSRDGGQVARKVNRPWNYKSVTGFAHPNYSAAGSGLITYDDIVNSFSGGSSGLLLSARPGDYIYTGNRRFMYNSPIRRYSGGDSSLVDSTTRLLNNISSTAATKANNGAITPELLTKLLTAITKILQNIDSNTSSVKNIYTVLSQYLSGGGSEDKPVKSRSQRENAKPDSLAGSISSKSSSDVDDGFKELVGILADLAKG